MARRDMATILIRNSVGAEHEDAIRCSCCKRTPLTGELMHVLVSGQEVCALCLAQLPDGEHETIRSERVRAAERKLRTAPRAA